MMMLANTNFIRQRLGKGTQPFMNKFAFQDFLYSGKQPVSDEEQAQLDALGFNYEQSALQVGNQIAIALNLQSVIAPEYYEKLKVALGSQALQVDHKIFSYDNGDPTPRKVRDKIIPDKILNADYNIRLNFFIGYFSGDGSKCRNSRVKTIRFSNKGKIGSSHLYYLVKSLGYECSIQVRKDKLNIYRLNCCIGTDWRRKQRKAPYVVKKMLDLGYNNENEFVYDIETEQGCFNGGVGEIVCNNTDSIFIRFKIPDHMNEFSKEALKHAIKIAQDAENFVTYGLWKGKKELVPLPVPHLLEYEKTYLPLILFSKKRYSGWLYEFDAEKPKYLDSKGIILKRRDNCRFLKKVYEGCLYRILNNQVDNSIKFLQNSLKDIINNHQLQKYPITDFIISKTVKTFSKYKRDSKTMEILDDLENQQKLILEELWEIILQL